jgi:hypothetical protein
MRQLAVIGSEDLARFMRCWAEAIDISNEVLCEAAGLSSGSVGHLLSANPTRRLGPVSRDALLGAMGLRVEQDGGRLAVYLDEDAFVRMRPRLVKRGRNGRRRFRVA